MNLIRIINTQTNSKACNEELAIHRSGWAIFHSRPDMRANGQVIWQDLMIALGHTSTLSTKHRAPNHAQTQAFCWLASSRIENLAVTSANFLSARHLNDLCAMTSALDIKIWLLDEIEPSAERFDARENLAATTSHMDEFINARSAYKELAIPSISSFGFELSDTHFLEFLDRAITSVQHEPDSEELKLQILEYFHHGKKEMLNAICQDPDIDEAKMGLILHGITSHTNNVNEVTCLVNGAQAAAFLSGWSLKVDISRWLQRGKFSSLSLTLDQCDWSSLGRFQSPCMAAAVTLSVLGISSDDMPFMDISAIRENATSISFKKQLIPVPLAAQELIRVQMHYRNLVSSNQQLFLVQGPKEAIVSPRWTGALMRTATKETGVALRARSATRRSVEQGSWTLRSGISVVRIAS